MFLGHRDTSDPIPMVSFTLTVCLHHIRLTSTPFTSFCSAKFRWTPFADLCMRHLATKQNAEFTRKVGKNSCPIMSCVGTTHAFQCPCPIACVISFIRYSLLSLPSCGKTKQMPTFFGPIFCERRPPNFLQQIVSAIYCPYNATVF